ncbi:hypothetical protein [Streptomyces sp. ME01-18h]|uniref:hypothetical protein n=1 Tax=Streptomyces sp. ME01-18h TaxID=462920 RepID=UPI0029BAAE00|nr:hypothetical protein [Streptomyces sp. ME01-18h]MDX3398461.1 hypothetical protein [Streptomyces sp. ME01-18h]
MSTTAEPGNGLRIIGWCAWCQNAADNVRIIQVDEQGSGAGGVRSACRPCIDKHGLTLFAEQPPAATPDPPMRPGYCSWHNQSADHVERIQLSEAGSGGKVHYACVHCIRVWKLTPADEDQ